MAVFGLVWSGKVGHGMHGLKKGGACVNYTWKAGAHTRGLDIKKVAPVLERLEAKGEGLTPNAVLREASKARSPLHGWFEWDDTEAAKQYRLAQARELVRSVDVTVVTAGEQSTVRAFVHMGERYEPAVTVLSVVDKREALLARALAELQSFRRKYEVLEELAAVFAAMDEAEA